MTDATPNIDQQSDSYWAAEAGRLAADNAFLKQHIAKLEEARDMWRDKCLQLEAQLEEVKAALEKQEDNNVEIQKT